VGTADELPGFSTQQKTRVQILTKLEELLRNKMVRVYSRRLYEQLQAFIWNGVKPQAQKDSHDDLIISLAIGVWLVGGSHEISQRDIALSMAILKSTSRISRDSSSLPLVNDAQPLVNPNIRGLNPNTVHRPKQAHQLQGRAAEASDFRWLLR
jgi:hypothetical protein